MVPAGLLGGRQVGYLVLIVEWVTFKLETFSGSILPISYSRVGDV